MGSPGELNDKMEPLEDEGEIIPETVTDYEITVPTGESISFAELPLEWNKDKLDDGKSRKIFLSGKIDNGLQSIMKPIIAWKFDLSCQKQRPEISVLSDSGHWIKLLKPRSRFQPIIRTIQISLNFLHFCKSNPQGSQRDLWDHLNKVFRVFERRPSEDDLRGHLTLIKEAVQRDETLANSKVITTFLDGNPWKRKVFNEDVSSPFIVDDADEDEDGDGNKSTNMDKPRVAECNEDEVDQSDEDEVDQSDEDEVDEDDCWDSVCAICDNGGRILICDGKCMRSFHPTERDGQESFCESLGFSEEEFEAMNSVRFFCKNCMYKKHQCFACGELGSSDESSGNEVFCCVNGACGYFYHPLCVAKLLHPGNHAASEEHAKRIASGEQFACPAHRCHVCKELEVKKDPELGFAVCRRCPRVYHRKCLPREIASESDVSEDKSGKLVQRAWENLIPHRLLIYCLEHKIDPEICTPARDHIKFPGAQPKIRIKSSFESRSNREMPKERVLPFRDNAGKGILSKQPNRADIHSKQGDLSRNKLEKLSVLGSSRKQKVDATVSSVAKLKGSTMPNDGKMSLGDKLYSIYGMEAEQPTSARGKAALGQNEMAQKFNPTEKSIDSHDTPDNESRRRVSELMKVASSSITLDKVKKMHRAPSTHAHYSSIDNITLGKVEGTVQALRAALKKLDEGGSVQDAKAFCDDDLLAQVSRWKEKLKVYLAPFLFGKRYTSFGRHFTRIDKLKEIANVLHWYIEDQDMLVDFCCGSNDFSCIMKKKLDEMGKRPSFKNYDIMQPKNDFNFERRNWMEVRPSELPSGSQLIMGLNPPFGVNAALANKFINKALQFKPKLIILIVPRETQRLDVKESPYDLIWEDDQMFVGKSFYLPGSVDANDKQIEDWNMNPPLLSLWSRRDFTPRHKAIAEQHGHLSGVHKTNRIHGSDEDMDISNSSEECRTRDESFLNQGEDVHPHKPVKQERVCKEDASQQEECQTLDESVVNQGEDVHPHKPVKQERVCMEDASHQEVSILRSSNGERDTNCTLKNARPKDHSSQAASHLESSKHRCSSGERGTNHALENARLIEHSSQSGSHVESSTRRSSSGERDTNHTVENARPKEHSSQLGSKRKGERRSDDRFVKRKYSKQRSVPQHPSRNVGDHFRVEPSERPGASALVNDGRNNHHQFGPRNLLSNQPGYHEDETDVDYLVREYGGLNREEPRPPMVYANNLTPVYGATASTDPWIGFPQGLGHERDPTFQSYPDAHGREAFGSWSLGSLHPSNPLHPRVSSHGEQLNPAANLPYGGMAGASAMQRYAPRLDNDWVAPGHVPPQQRGIYYPPQP